MSICDNPFPISCIVFSSQVGVRGYHVYPVSVVCGVSSSRNKMCLCVLCNSWVGSFVCMLKAALKACVLIVNVWLVCTNLMNEHLYGTSSTFLLLIILGTFVTPDWLVSHLFGTAREW